MPMDPQTAAEMLASGYDVPKPRFNTLAASKGNGFDLSPLKKLLFGDPEAKTSFPLGELNHPPSTWSPEVRDQVFDATTAGGMAATGAPELMTRSLLAPAVTGIKNAAKAAPLTTGTVGGALAGAATPSSTGKTPWEVMQENWEAKRQGLKGQIAAEDAIIAGEAEKLKMSPEDTARLEAARTAKQNAQAVYERWKAQGKGDVPAATRAKGQMDAAQATISDLENRGGRIETQRKASEAVTGPATERRKAAQAGLDDLENEIISSQTPLRQKSPLGAAVSLIPPWLMAYYGGKAGGKTAHNLFEAKASKMEDLLTRARQHVADTTGAKGRATTAQFSPRTVEGAALLRDLKGAEGKVIPPGWQTPYVTGTGAVFGGAAGAAAPVGFTAMDAQMAPGGSPLSQASGWDALKSPSFWSAAAPEMAMGALLGAKGARSGFQSKGGPVMMPQAEVNSLSWAANNVPKWPTRTPSTPKAKAASKTAPKGKAKAAAPDEAPDL